MAITSSASGIGRIESILGEEAEDLLGHECTTIARDRLHLPGPDFVDRVVKDSDRPTPVLRSLQSHLLARPPGRHGLRLDPARRPGHRALGGRVVRQEPRLLRPRGHHQARDRGRLQRRRLDARRARGVLAQVRAPHPVHRQAQPQRVPQLSERLRPDHVRAGQAGARDGRRGRRRDDLLRLGRVEAADRRGLAGLRDRARARASPRSSGATCATRPSTARRTAGPTTTPPPT